MSERRKKKKSRKKSKSSKSGSKKRKSSGRSSKSRGKKKEDQFNVEEFLDDLHKIKISSGNVGTIKLEDDDDNKRRKSTNRNKSPGPSKKVRFKDEGRDFSPRDELDGGFVGRGGRAPVRRGRGGMRGRPFDRRNPGYGGLGRGGRDMGRFGSRPMGGPMMGGGPFPQKYPASSSQGMNMSNMMSRGGPPVPRTGPSPAVLGGPSPTIPQSQPQPQQPQQPPSPVDDLDTVNVGVTTIPDILENEKYFVDEVGTIFRMFYKPFGQSMMGKKRSPVMNLKPFDDRCRAFYRHMYTKLTKDATKEIKALKIRNNKMKSERDELKTRVMDTSGEYEKKMKLKENELKGFEEEMTNRANENEQRVNDVVARLRHIQMKKHQYKKEKMQVSEEKERVEEILGKVKEENERYTVTMEEKDKRIMDLEEEVQRMHHEVTESTRSHEEYRQRTKQSRKRLKTSHRQYLRKHEELESQGEELRKQVEGLEGKINQLQASNNQLKESNEQLSEKNDGLSETNQELLRQNGEIEKKYDDILRKHSEMHGRGKKMNWKHTEIERKNAELMLRNEENARLMKELKETSESLKNTNLEKSRRLASLLEEMNHLKMNSFETIKRLKKESLQSQNQLLKLTDVYSKRTGENELRNEAVEAQLRQSRTESRNLKINLEKAQKKYIDLAKQVGTFKDSHDRTSGTNEKLRNRLQIVAELEQNLRKKMEDSHRMWTQKVNDLQREKRHLLAEKIALTEKTQNLSDEVISTHKKLSDSVRNSTSTVELYEAQTRETQQARASLEKYQEEVNRLERLLHDKDEKLSNLSQQKVILETVSTTRSADFKDQIERGSIETEAWRERYETLNQSYKENVTQHFELKKRHEELNVDFLRSQRELQKRIVDLESRIRELIEEKRQISEKFFMANDDLKEEQKVKEGLSVQSSLIGKEKEDLKQEIKRLSETLDSVIEKKDLMEKKNEEFMQLIRDNNRGLNDLRKQNEELRNKILEDQEMMKNLDEEKSESLEHKKKLRHQFKNEVFFRTSQNNKLIQENTRLVNDNHTLRRKINELTNMLTSIQQEEDDNQEQEQHQPSIKGIDAITFGQKEKLEYVELKVANSTLVGSNTALIEENERLKRDLDLVKIRFQQQLRSAKKMNSKFKKKLKKLKKEKEVEKKIMLEEEEEEDGEENEEKKLKKLVRDLEKRNSDISMKYKSSLRNYLELQQSFQQQQRSNNDVHDDDEPQKILERKLEEANVENQNLREEVKSFQLEIVKLMSHNNNNSEEEEEEEDGIINPFRERYEQLLSSKIAVEQEVKKLEHRIAEKEAEVTRLHRTIEAQKEVSRTTGKREQEVSEEFKLLQHRLEIVTETKNSRIRDLEEKLEKCKDLEMGLGSVRKDQEVFEQQKKSLQKLLVENIDLKNMLALERKKNMSRYNTEEGIKQTIEKLANIMKEDNSNGHENED